MLNQTYGKQSCQSGKRDVLAKDFSCLWSSSKFQGQKIRCHEEANDNDNDDDDDDDGCDDDDDDDDGCDEAQQEKMMKNIELNFNQQHFQV